MVCMEVLASERRYDVRFSLFSLYILSVSICLPVLQVD